MNDETKVSLARTVPAAIVRSGIQHLFIKRLKKAADHVRSIVVVSPWITGEAVKGSALTTLLKIIESRGLPTYIITRRPRENAHLEAVTLLTNCPTVELVYNDNVHAKIFAATAPPPHGFAILGSANLTLGSLDLYEIGLLVMGTGGGSAVVDDLANFGIHLRSQPESKVIKKMAVRSIRNVV